MAKLVARFIPGLTMSLALAAGVLGADVLGAGAAQAQTVGDYTAAMAAAPITDPAAEASAAYCRPLTNYVYTSIPDNQRSSWVLPLVTLDGTQSAETSAKRDACLKVRQQALIAFDAGTGEQIVTRPRRWKARPTAAPITRSRRPTPRSRTPAASRRASRCSAAACSKLNGKAEQSGLNSQGPTP